MANSYEFVPLDGDSRRQYINARDALAATRAAEQEALKLTGSLAWRVQNKREYLIQVSTRGSQTSLGPRSAKTEAVHLEFHRRKAIVLERLAALRRKMQVHARLNRAQNIARADSMLVDVLNGFYLAGISDNIVVVDPNALFCYETGAGVRIEYASPARQTGVIWNDCTQLTLTAPRDLLPSGLLSILTKIDKSFKLRNSTEFHTAVNSNGYQVKLLRQTRSASDRHSRSEHDNDFWAIADKNLSWLLRAPIFQSTVINKKGAMSQMTTLDPRAFALYWKWMSEHDGLDTSDRHHYAVLAALLTDLIAQYLPQYRLD
ncbi:MULTISPECIES: GSU2403 family nucleotidyltransferase fold protein [Duganella]|uniref:Nucleotidyltransferase-like domain-containing protein n=2 Tax=Duganella TaxID=75654 RepID=A0A845GPC3_9BURK|nr:MULTISPECIES: GSU2403 family nucleotidyltransferase fold protein [Duganella]MYM80772.1 hypothetical protein [Duganella lactea]MYM96124.1 hypothetical protein [Duganella vulcania]